MKDKNQEEQMVIIAWLYYVEHLTHEAIAEKMNLSRVGVTRILQKARSEGIVRFSITRPLPEHFKLENRFKEKFNLRSVTIVRTLSSPLETNQEVCRAAAFLLSKRLFAGCRLGLAFSQTLSSMVDYLDQNACPGNITIQELTGTYLSPDAPYGISWRIAEKIKAHLVSIPVPVVVQSEDIRNMILQEPSIREAFSGFSRVDLAMIGLGNVDPHSTLVKAHYYTPAEMLEQQNRGAVGELLLYFYDNQGKFITNPLQNRMIVIPREDILRIKDVIGVACGPEKVDAIRGALLTGVVHHLVTDQETAIAVMGQT
jgi:DNA-binding transcriptional regulator LsrR (DeoR family)